MKNKNKEPNEYRAAIESLKAVLKAKQITYKELAQAVKLSESGLKKIFAAQDGSFQRLAQISRYIGISLSELIEENKTVDVGFSQKQQTEFLKEPLLFQVYWMLVYERRKVDSIQDELKLNKTEAFRILRRLDILDLIKLLPGDRLRIPSVKAVRWTGDGEFIRKMYREWSRNLVSDVAKVHSEPEELFIIRYFQMTPKTYTELLAAQKALEAEFIRRGIQEMRTRPPGLVHVRWLVAADTRSFITGKKSFESQ